MKYVALLKINEVEQIFLKCKKIFDITLGEVVQVKKLENRSWDIFGKEYDLCENNFPSCENIDIPILQDDFGNFFLEFENWNERSHYLQILDQDINLYDYCLRKK